MNVNESLSVREACRQASSFLREHHVGEHDAVAELLIRHLLGWNRTAYFFRWNEPFPAEKHEQWQLMLQRKAAGEPAQYIVGEQEFYGLPFTVNSSVLIPRPETELLVEQIIRLGEKMWPQASPAMADVGTGSGAIAAAVAFRCRHWQIFASDISTEALQTAKQNAKLNGAGDRVTFFSGDMLEPFIRKNIRLDILVSNPPYISAGDISSLQREVRDYEPLNALVGGTDGLIYYRRIAEQVRLLPSVPRLVGLEVGFGQAGQVVDILRRTGFWSEIKVIADLAGIDRHVIASNENE